MTNEELAEYQKQELVKMKGQETPGNRSLRDEIAMRVFTARIAAGYNSQDETKIAVVQADALIAELVK